MEVKFTFSIDEEVQIKQGGALGKVVGAMVDRDLKENLLVQYADSTGHLATDWVRVGDLNPAALPKGDGNPGGHPGGGGGGH